MLEGGRPPKCKMPRPEYQRNDFGQQLPRLNNVCKVVVSWAPAHSLAEVFELYMAVEGAGYRMAYVPGIHIHISPPPPPSLIPLPPAVSPQVARPHPRPHDHPPHIPIQTGALYKGGPVPLFLGDI